MPSESFFISFTCTPVFYAPSLCSLLEKPYFAFCTVENLVRICEIKGILDNAIMAIKLVNVNRDKHSNLDFSSSVLSYLILTSRGRILLSS